MQESDCNNMAASIHGIVRSCERNAIHLAGGAIELRSGDLRSGRDPKGLGSGSRRRAYVYEVIFDK
jgi:hypothetical protein